LDGKKEAQRWKIKILRNDAAKKGGEEREEGGLRG
jgi:hypothetical protein